MCFLQNFFVQAWAGIKNSVWYDPVTSMLLPTLFIFIIPYYSSIEQFFLQWYNSVYNRGQKGTPMESVFYNIF